MRMKTGRGKNEANKRGRGKEEDKGGGEKEMFSGVTPVGGVHGCTEGS